MPTKEQNCTDFPVLPYVKQINIQGPPETRNQLQLSSHRGPLMGEHSSPAQFISKIQGRMNLNSNLQPNLTMVKTH